MTEQRPISPAELWHAARQMLGEAECALEVYRAECFPADDIAYLEEMLPRWRAIVAATEHLANPKPDNDISA